MQTLDYKKTGIIIVLLAALSVALYFLFKYREDEAALAAKNAAFYADFNENFGGFVTELKNGKRQRKNAPETCLVLLDIKSSTLEIYDKRETDEPYFCVLTNDKAELILQDCDMFLVGDRVFFDGQIDSLYIYRNKALVHQMQPLIGTRNAKKTTKGLELETKPEE